MKYAIFNENGFPTAFYSSEINNEIPTDAIEITENQWYSFIDNPGLRKWVNGSVVLYTPPPTNTTVVPSNISRRQCALELYNRQMITSEEAVQMATVGALPQLVQDMFLYLTPEELVIARIDFAAQSYERNNALLVSSLSYQNYTSSQIDDFFISAATR